MQTFLPYSDFVLSAKVLDTKRLGKQRLEASQIISTLEKIKSGDIYKDGKKIAWLNHPAVRMWQGYEEVLKTYYNCILSEWESRGYKNTMPYMNPYPEYPFPPWLGNENFHSSHRSNLLRKNYNHYKLFGWKESTDLPYVWPRKGE